MSTVQQANATLDPAIVETIVRQVMERLSALNSETKIPGVHNQSRSTSNESEVLELDQSVITLESLRGRLAGKKKLVVGSQAVLTPAVHDELKENGVQLETRKPAKSGCSIGETFCLARLSNHYVPVDWLKAEGLGEICCGDDFLQLAEKLGRDQPRGKTVCFAAQPFVAVAALNRNESLRAAYARSAKEIREINSTLNANVLVLDSVQPRKELLELIRGFVNRRQNSNRQQCNQHGARR